MIAAYLINRMTIASFNWQSPYERLFKRILDYTHLRKFRCLCFAARVGPNKDKFELRSIKTVMIGYGGTHNTNFMIYRQIIF